VNISDLEKQFRSEIASNPRKAIVLGIMVAVGLCFLAARLHGLLSESSDTQGVPVGAQVVTTTSPEQAASVSQSLANKEVEPSQHDWKEVLKWRSTDPRTSPAPPLAAMRNPFHVRKEATEKPVVEEPVAAKPVPVSPTSLGMTLTSTIVAQNGGIARIGGKVYNLGQAVEIAKEGRDYKFTLTEIHDRRVVLEMDGERFELNIPEPGASSHMVLGTIAK
jgi:hypothetical protein